MMRKGGVAEEELDGWDAWYRQDAYVGGDEGGGKTEN